MPRRYTGKITVRTIEQTRKNGDIYVIEEQRQYNPEKHYTVTVASKLLGVKKKGTDKIVPTRARRRFVNITKEEVSPLGEVNAVRKHVGMMDIINCMSETSGIDTDIRAVSDFPTADKIMSMAQFIVCSASHSLAGIEEWQYTHDLPYKDGINKSIYHTLFKEIGIDESLQQGFFKMRLNREDKLGLYLACDSTQISTYSENLTDDIARYGYDRKKDKLPKVKYIVLFSLKTKMPVLFTELPGNIPDVITVTTVINQLKALGIKKVTFVTDNGYFSEPNIGEMIGQGYNFITLADIDVNWIKNEVDKFYKTIQNIVYACPSDLDTHGITWPVIREFEWTRTTDSKSKNLKAGDKDKVTKTVHLHMFFNPERKIAKDRAIKSTLFEAKKQLESGIKLETMTEDTRKLINSCCNIKRDDNGNIIKIEPNHYNFEQYCKYNGLFVVISNQKIDCDDCLRWYRRREAIEDFFRRAKGDTNMDNLSVWNKDTLRGRMFVQFVALCLYQYTENEINRVKESLLKDTDTNGKAKTKELKEKEKKLLKMLTSRSIVRILNWFDAYDKVDISVKLRLKRWSEPTISYEKIFLERLGVIHENK